MTTAPAVAMRAVRPLCDADLPDVVDLLGGVYGLSDPATARRLYAWKYLDATGRPAGQPSAFVARRGDELVGFMGCLPFVLRCGARRLPAGWVADWHLAAQARGEGLGRALLRAALQAVPAVACVGGTADAERLFRDEGFTAYDGAGAWLRVRRPVAFERPTRSARAWPATLYRAAGHARARLRAALRPPSAAVLDPAPDDVAELPGDEPRDGPVRDAGYLAWLARCPAVPPPRRLVIRDGGAAVGHALLHLGVDGLGRARGRVLHLTTSGDRRAAYRGAAEWLERQGATYVEVVASGTDAAPLRATGFRRRGGRRFWVRLPFAPPPAGHPWAIALADKDDAFRGAPGIP